MAKLKIELCPETGICSILKDDGSKVDLMPDEVKQIAKAGKDAAKAKAVIAASDAAFAAALSDAELAQVQARLGKRGCGCCCGG